MKKIIKIIRLIRAAYWCARLKKCGNNFLCCSGCIIHGAKHIEVGNNVRFGERSCIHGHGGLTIGNNVRFGPEVFVWTMTHNYYAPKKLPFDDIDFKRPVNIGDNVWIGAKVCIIPGVSIGEGAVVAMGANVTKDIPPCAVVGGNPAKILKYRDVEVYNKLKAECAK